MSNLIDYEINKELGECYLFMGEYAKARDYYNKAVTACGDYCEPFLGLAAIEMQFGNVDAAHSYYRKAVAAESTSKSLAGLGLIEMETGSHDLAFDHFTQSLAHDPENIISLNGMLQSAYHLNRLGDALGYLEGALGMQDADPVRFALAGCLTSLGRESEAREHLEILLSRNPQYTCAQELYASIAA